MPCLAATVVVLVLGLLTLELVFFEGRGLSQDCLVSASSDPQAARAAAQQHGATLRAFFFGFLLTTPCVASLLARAGAASWYFQSVGCYTFLGWLSLWLFTCRRMIRCGSGGVVAGELSILVRVGQVMYCTILLCQLVVFGELLHGRLRSLELRAMQPMGVYSVGKLLRASTLAYLADLACLVAKRLAVGGEAGDEGIAAIASALSWMFLGFYLAACLVTARIALGVRHLTLDVAATASGRRRAEAEVAAKTLAWQLQAVGVGMASTCAKLLFLLSDHGALKLPAFVGVVGRSLHIPDTVPFLVDTIMIFIALSRSGALSGRLGATRAAARREMARRERWAAASAGWRRDAEAAEVFEDEDHLWHEKVTELAGRGFTLDALLQFYRGLGQEYMPHYSPRHHTTTDVVRAAVIPLSSAGRCSYATVMMRGRYTRPNKMVTHNWSNLFRDVVAAIIADALEEDEYAMISFLLERDIDKLEQWIAARGTGQRTYWVCAFSVNQHCGICGGNPQRTRDSVTMEVHPTCDCGLAKAWNGTKPLRRDGRGIACEMNKFNDMMRFLSATDPDFEQVVAVDSAFALFSRAWCVAELAAADAAGMVQNLKLESADSLVKHEDRLRRLEIRSMEATRLEDKEDILNGIADVDEFDAHLQRLLFEDLLPAWQCLDITAQMARIGRIARWQNACKDRGNPRLWQAGVGDASTPVCAPVQNGHWTLTARSTRCWWSSGDLAGEGSPTRELT